LKSQIAKNHQAPAKLIHGDWIYLPYAIPNNLILKSRLNTNHVIDILKRNKIFEQGTNRYDKDHVKYAYFRSKKGDVALENYEMLYKKVKICSQCFMVYSLVQKSFTKEVQAINKEYKSKILKKFFNYDRKIKINEKQTPKATLSIKY
jgi:alpha-tubulin suppressor-like RCC1 family protein